MSAAVFIENFNYEFVSLRSTERCRITLVNAILLKKYHQYLQHYIASFKKY